MMSEIEDGEILSEEEEDTTKAKTVKNTDNSIDVYNVTTRPERPQLVDGCGHRGTASKELVYSDEDTDVSSSDSDDDSHVARKQPRRGSAAVNNCGGTGYKKDAQWLARAHQSVMTQQGKKVNNVWGSVMQEEDMTKFVNQLNRNDAISYEERGAESYDYTQAKSDPRFSKEIGSEDSDESSSSSEEEDQGPADLTEKETFGFVMDKPKKKSVKSRLGTKEGNRKGLDDDFNIAERKSGRGSAKSRLGNVKCGDNKQSNWDNNGGGETNTMEIDSRAGENNTKITSSKECSKNRNRKRQFQSRQSWQNRMDDIVDVKKMKPVQIKDEMDDMELVDTIIDSLREPQDQTELFLKIIDEIGRAKLVKIFKATEDIEDMGGLLIQNGSRRRTPGGVFLFLVRKDSDISQEQISAIFADQNSQYLAKRKEERKARKKLTNRLKREEASRRQKANLMETERVAKATVMDSLNTECEAPSQKMKLGLCQNVNVGEDKGDNDELDNEEMVDIQLE